jgi:multisubunit Na+/H+ antiporter MnhB subunit
MSSATTATSSSSHAASPIPVFLIGVANLLFWVIGSLLQIQTSEAFLLKARAVSFMPNWAIVQQPYLLVIGHLTPDLAKATMWGWGIELIYLVFIVGYEIAHEGIRTSNQRLAGWFRTGTIAIIAFDAYTDFQYGNLASGFWGQVAFAAITAFSVMFCGLIGFHLMKHAITEWSR